jgi:predicted transcriptional regulator of viral defense system
MSGYEISDINPNEIHLTIAKNRRLRRSGGERYVIHHQDLTDKQRGWFEQMPITTVPTTIELCIDWGTPTYLVKQALERTEGTSLLPKDQREALAARLHRRDYGR